MPEKDVQEIGGGDVADVSAVAGEAGLEQLLDERAALNDRIAEVQKALPPAFKPGDRVGIAQELAIHAPESVLRASALPAAAKQGVIKAAANEQGTWFTVTLANGDEAVFTADELVRISKVGD